MRSKDKIAKIGGDSVFVIAEISANHGQNFDRAIELIRKAKHCGADAVKFQTYTPDTITINETNEYFQIEHPEWGGQTLYELYEKAYTPWEWFGELKRAAQDVGILFFSAAFDPTAVDLLEGLDVPMHKIASPELVDIPLIEYMAKTKKPLMLSTGMATIAEIDEAVRAAEKCGVDDIFLLRCVSAYPADPKEMNLQTIPHMRDLFGYPVGISDHTIGIGVSIAAVSLGAKIVEKHFTLSREIKTPDGFFSLEPEEFRTLVENVRIVEKALGRIHYGLTREERKSHVSRRSLFVVKDVKRGEYFTLENVRSIRPSQGLSPKYLPQVLGRKASRDIDGGTPLSLDLIG